MDRIGVQEGKTNTTFRLDLPLLHFVDARMAEQFHGEEYGPQLFCEVHVALSEPIFSIFMLISR
jgi:hypothetical protein